MMGQGWMKSDGLWGFLVDKWWNAILLWTQHPVATFIWSANLSILPAFAEVPSRHVVELARVEVSNNPHASGKMREFSQVRLEDAEIGVHQVLSKYGLSCPLEIEYVNLGSDELKSFPYLKFSTWLEYLGLRRISRQLVGTSSLSRMKAVLFEFWNRFEKINPQHQVFEMAASNQLKLKYTIPFFSHSDEGRSYKKEALWILSVHGCLGRGTQNYLKHGKHKTPLRRNQLGLNFVGQSWSTQYLFATMMRELSTKNPDAMQELLAIFARDASELATRGLVTSDGVRLWFLHLGCKGDLPALGKCAGSLKRTFSHCPRAPTSKKACGGICHLCLAGQEEVRQNGINGFPYEDLSESPSWLPTRDLVLPWDEEPRILEGLPLNFSQRARFFQFDVWHLFHLGVAKHYLASALVVIVESRLPALTPYRSVEAKFEWLTQVYRQYCRDNRLSTWVKELSCDSLQWPQGSACPLGKWNKGAASTTIMLFLGFFCEKYIAGKTEDELLLLIAA